MELDTSSLKILSNLIKHKKENWYTITALKYWKKNVLGGGQKSTLIGKLTFTFESKSLYVIK